MGERHQKWHYLDVWGLCVKVGIDSGESSITINFCDVLPIGFVGLPVLATGRLVN